MRKEYKEKKKRLMPIPKLVLIDILTFAVAINVFALFHHVLPKKYDIDESKLVNTRPTTEYSSISDTSVDNSSENSSSKNESVSSSSIGDFSSKFADMFTDGDVVSTDTIYQSEDVSITVSTYTQSDVVYYIEDIYISNIENLRTAFAGGSYAKSVTDWPIDMAKENNAIAAINGDYYGIHDSGIVIRNGLVYRDVSDNTNDVCVLYWNGEMKVFSASEFDVDQAIDDGAYQAWSFGPNLLDENSEAIIKFSSSVSKSNPRTAIGYYEPGHYCFISVDGRGENDSEGLTLAELSKLCEDLGLAAAYNLDGGKSSAMTFGDSLVNSPCGGGREDTDIIYIGE